MTWPDFVTIGLCILLAFVESKRGFVASLLDMIGAVLVLEVAASAYWHMHSLSYVSAYLLLIGLGILIVAVATTLFKRYTEMDIGALDSSLAGLLGIFTGLLLAHAMYGAVILAYGRNAQVYRGSLLAGQVYDLNAVHSFLRFMGRIGSANIASPGGGS